MLYTTLDPKETMTDSTFQIMTESLIEEVNSHPHKDELLELMMAQMIDDMTTPYLD